MAVRVVLEGGEGVADDEVVRIVDVGMLVNGGRVVVGRVALVLIGAVVVLEVKVETAEVLVGDAFVDIGAVLVLVDVGASGNEEVTVGAGKDVRILCGVEVLPVTDIDAVGVGIGTGGVMSIDMLIVSFCTMLAIFSTYTQYVAARNKWEKKASD